MTALNLLELMSYDKHILLSVEPSAMIDLVDYLCRKIAYLLSDTLEKTRQNEDAEEKVETKLDMEDVLKPDPPKVSLFPLLDRHRLTPLMGRRYAHNAPKWTLNLASLRSLYCAT